jgi:hypothetical protein
MLLPERETTTAALPHQNAQAQPQAWVCITSATIDLMLLLVYRSTDEAGQMLVGGHALPRRAQQ